MLRSIAAVTLLSLVPLTSVSGAGRVPPQTARIASGSFRPLYGSHGSQPVAVKAFAIDTVAVSAADFLRFTEQHPQWRRNSVSAAFADAQYLAGVIADSKRPVTNVSWHAADAYCRARGARLPSTNEWEYIARASESDRNAASQQAFKQRVLELTMSATPGQFRLGSGFRNAWGVRDLHGGPMEWTSDYQAIFNHSAHGSGHSATMACSAGTVETGDASDYAAFMRYAFRRSVTPNSAPANVGFRCAVSL